MENRAFSIVLIVCGFLSILFQVIGIASPAWRIFDVNINTEDTSLSESIGLGLFTGHACVDTGYGKQCADFTMDMLVDAIDKSDETDSSKTAAEGLIGSILPLQLLAIFGGIASIIAICIVVAYGKMAPLDSSRKCSGVFGACVWILSGILLIAAVGYEANQYTTFKNALVVLSKIPDISDKIQISVQFPWAAAMTGIGALLCFVNGLIFSLWLCFTVKEETGTAGTWNKFTNHAI